MRYCSFAPIRPMDARSGGVLYVDAGNEKWEARKGTARTEGTGARNRGRRRGNGSLCGSKESARYDLPAHRHWQQRRQQRHFFQRLGTGMQTHLALNTAASTGSLSSPSPRHIRDLTTRPALQPHKPRQKKTTLETPKRKRTVLNTQIRTEAKYEYVDADHRKPIRKWRLESDVDTLFAPSLLSTHR
ncbi:hypothetical protein K438DRAFT_1778893 [Mycena galopus ATCC 62051]|nr:hypothetical protein K438DRAFT_1778893 [Mycena galopus ATCC 62051]